MPFINDQSQKYFYVNLELKMFSIPTKILENRG